MNNENESMKQIPGKWNKFRQKISRGWNRIQPGHSVRKGAAWGITVITALLLIFIGFFETPGLPGFINYASGSIFFLLMGALLGFAFLAGFEIITTLPKFINRTGLAAVFVMTMLFVLMRLLSPIGIYSVALLSLSGAIFGGGLAALSRRGFRFNPRIKKGMILTAVILPLAFFAYVILWLSGTGNTEHLTEAIPLPAKISALDAANPARSGIHAFRYLTYGSGTDTRRPEFGEEAIILTPSVNAEPFLKGNEGFKMKIRKWYWGFAPNSFPLNGRVWYPEGPGPFPLILIVHGNHKMEEYSDPGYAYLGEHFASRGYIFVSVDENFFNGGFLSSLSKENDGRAWILLQHLSLWREWNQNPENLFYQKADMENIGLIGHSRGGEAAAIAGNFNRLPYYPDDASVKFDFRFNIKGVAAIAPSDQQYQPADRPNPLENINYLVLQGGHDADVSLFLGARQFSRVRFSEDPFRFKASIYIYRANHGQFNTVWGDLDYGLPLGFLLNRKPLLSGEQQRKIGKIYLTAFFAFTLKDDSSYLPMFRDHRRIQDWLPQDIYISRYQDSTFFPVCEYSEDVDLTTGSIPGVIIQGENLTVWREGELKFRSRGTKQNSCVYVGWRGPASERKGENAPAYSILLPETLDRPKTSRNSYLVFSLCESDEGLPEIGDSTESSSENGPEPENSKKINPPLSFSIVLTDASGRSLKKSVEDFMRVPPVIRSRFTKINDESGLYGSDYEPTLQTVHVPLAEFNGEENGPDTSKLRSVKFVFDRGREGILVLDDIGFSRKLQDNPPKTEQQEI